VKSFSDFSFKIWAVSFSNAWYVFYMISVWQLSVGVPLSNQYFLVNIFELVQYPACFIMIWSRLKMMITSVFSKCVKKWSIHGIRNQSILRRLWYIFYTILLNIFLLVWFISNWMLSLEYWKLGHISNMKTALESIFWRIIRKRLRYGAGLTWRGIPMSQIGRYGWVVFIALGFNLGNFDEVWRRVSNLLRFQRQI
jgi:hypothetical protein